MPFYSGGDLGGIVKKNKARDTRCARADEYLFAENHFSDSSFLAALAGSSAEDSAICRVRAKEELVEVGLPVDVAGGASKVQANASTCKSLRCADICS